jgi:hypothetical protein
MQLPNNIKITEVHISVIKQGDTILHTDGHLRTVCKNNIKKGGFCGITIFGDSYKSGYQKVKKVEFTKPWEENI